MTDNQIYFIDVTDTLVHFLNTNELGGIPRLVITILEIRFLIPNVYFGIYRESIGEFEVIRNLASLDVVLLETNDLISQKKCIDDWIDLFNPELEPLNVNEHVDIKYIFLSSQWDTFYSDSGYQFLTNLLINESVTCLNHDSYLLEDKFLSVTSERYKLYWSTVLKSKANIFFVSEHSKDNFSRLFNSNKGDVARYDFPFSYPRTHGGVHPDAIKLALKNTQYILVFSVLDHRKDPLPIIKELVRTNENTQRELVLIVRFQNDNKLRNKEFIDFVLDHKIKTFYNPNDVTYISLIKYSSAVFYPSSKEGFGIVPFDCKIFGKFCYVPNDSDYMYLHDNVIGYSKEEPIGEIQYNKRAINNLKDPDSSNFIKLLFNK